jgi:hypothetical protein
MPIGKANMVDAKRRDDPQTKLIASLLRKVHEQSLDSPEPSPFWREGPWRCEFHRQTGEDRLKVFRGDRCVHEEIVEGRARAHTRCHELREVLMHDDSASGRRGHE